MYYLKNDTTEQYWNGDNWVNDLTVACLFEDYESALTEMNAKDLVNCTIKPF
jgi:hypothetical protein